ncbi:type II secretion system protein M [Maricaulis sp.]|uniref:type II secretion system protein M n=1 Tax=Maricaulis sp. TaxID=1486257 RepID=UPI002610C2FB|nr:type II secretion system protein M [Maricaulis sp.]
MNPVVQAIQTYWSGRSDREQVLLAIMFVMLAGLIGYLLLARPLIDFHQQARNDYAGSMRLYRAIEADAETYRALSSSGAAQIGSGQSLRSIVGSLAIGNQIAIARMIPGDDGSLTVNIERAETRAVMSWLIDLEERYGVQVMASTMDREGNEYAQISLVLRRGGGG